MNKKKTAIFCDQRLIFHKKMNEHTHRFLRIIVKNICTIIIDSFGIVVLNRFQRQKKKKKRTLSSNENSPFCYLLFPRSTLRCCVIRHSIKVPKGKHSQSEITENMVEAVVIWSPAKDNALSGHRL
jgi:hypothetical protein